MGEVVRCYMWAAVSFTSSTKCVCVCAEYGTRVGCNNNDENINIVVRSSKAALGFSFSNPLFDVAFCPSSLKKQCLGFFFAPSPTTRQHPEISANSLCTPTQTH